MKARAWVIGGALTAALAATSAEAAMDLSRDIVARGANPEWTLKVERGVQFTLIRPGKPALMATAPGAAISSAAATWSAKTTDGRPMQVTLQTRACAVGASRYPMTAQVTFGAETFSGCASPAP